MGISGVSSSTSVQSSARPASYDQQIEAIEKQIASLQDKVSEVDTDSEGSEEVTQQLQAQIQMLQAQLQQLQQQKAAAAQATQDVPAPKLDKSAQNSASTTSGGLVDLYA
ncbi:MULTISPECIES: FlxA-like family protein [unclassified Zymobacter]|uniref:FlxA-like family protein n=1 Tax=unclassified Zymobacter TaxID=3048685 RepID=UPI0039C18811